MKAGPYSLYLKINEVEKSEHVIMRPIEVYENGKHIQTVKHYHFLSWEDFEIPYESSIPSLINIMESTAVHITN